MNVVDISTRDVVVCIINDSTELLRHLDISKDNPFVDIYKIAYNLGLNILESSDVVDDHAILDGSTILLRKADSDEQKRFSIAHEIAHIRIDGQMEVIENDDKSKKIARQMNLTRKMRDNPRLGYNENMIEELLDYYAASLLLPSWLFSLIMDKSDVDIAKLCGVPLRCVEKRRSEISSELATLSNYVPTEEWDYSDILTYEQMCEIIDNA